MKELSPDSYRDENVVPSRLLSGAIGIRMKMLLKTCFIFILLLSSRANTQAQDFERQYKIARDFFKEGQYNLAMTAFNPLVTYDKDNHYSEYASFYYAISAYKQNYPTVARDMLIQMKKLYPTWEKMDEVNYWLATLYFEQREYFQGLLVLKSIQTPAFQEDITQLKRHFLVGMDDTETLTMMLEEHPQDAEVGRALARAISKQPYNKQDKAQLESVITKFNLNRDEFAQVDELAPLFKDRYKVSLLFPFLAKRNQNVLDLYYGMKLAKDTLDKQNIHIDLLAYDTEYSAERNFEPLKKLLESDELKSSDLLVGPLFPEESALVQEFSEKYRINMINPVSNKMEFLGTNSFSFLYQPSDETLGIKAAEYLSAHVHNKNCIVFYGDSPDDSIMAAGFIKTAELLGMKVVLVQEYNKETSGEIIPTLATETEYDELKNPIQFKLKRDSVGSIFIASDEPLIYSKVIAAVERRADSTVIVGNENWLINSSMDFEKFERLRIVMAAPNFTSVNNPEFLRFRRNYIQQYGVIPSHYDPVGAAKFTNINARIGYEFMLFVGHMLKTYGVYFQRGFERESFIPGNLVKGYNFQNTNNNQAFPFIKFRNGELIVAE